VDTRSRLLAYQDKVMKDSNGVLYEGEMIISLPDDKDPRGFIECVVAFHEGKVDNIGKWAAYFMDGHRESWSKGRFVSALPAYELQEKLPL
jgi:hypothetical protein